MDSLWKHKENIASLSFLSENKGDCIIIESSTRSQITLASGLGPAKKKKKNLFQKLYVIQLSILVYGPDEGSPAKQTVKQIGKGVLLDFEEVIN